MRLFTFWLALLATVLISACGGGGGSPGAVPGVTPPAPTLGLTLTDAAGNNLSTNAINGSATFFARALVRDSNNTPIPRQLVTFSTDAALATLSPTTALTDDAGVARVQIAPVAAGAASLMAVAQVGSASIQGQIAFQTTPSRTTLSDLSAAQPTLNTLQSTDVSVQVRVNNIPAIASEVSVTFSATCGSFSPTTAFTATGGLARTTYTPAANCSGPVTLTASAPNAVAVTSTITVSASVPSALRFISATESLLVVSTSSSGATTSQVRFQVLDDSATGIRGRIVTFNLDSRSIQSGVRFSVNGASTDSTQTATSDAGGFVQVVVRSGGIPTPVVVTASIVINDQNTIRASSSGLAVTTGRAVQDRISLSASSLAILASSGGGTIDGVPSTLTMRIADRLGNPVPNNTAINFLSSAGRVDGPASTPGSGGVSGVCFTLNSMCSVTFSTLGPIPTGGRVTILGFLDGEETFTDADGDNVWEDGEDFVNLGRIYLDLNNNGVYNPSDQLVGDVAPGDTNCLATSTTVANTCDTTWSGNTRVSTSIQIALSSAEGVITVGSRNIVITRMAMPAVMANPAAMPPVLAVPAVTAQFNGTLEARVEDIRGNSMPAGTTISVMGCVGATVSPTVIPNSVAATNIVVNFLPNTDACTLRITASPPGGTPTSSSTPTLLP